jgi:hypothetical protein
MAWPEDFLRGVAPFSELMANRWRLCIPFLLPITKESILRRTLHYFVRKSFGFFLLPPRNVQLLQQAKCLLSSCIAVAK